MLRNVDRRNDWQRLKDAIQVQLVSLEKCDVFGPTIRTHEGINPVG